MAIKKIIEKLKLKPLPTYQIAYLVVLLPFLIMLRFEFDNDFWFTINQGRYVLNHGFPTALIYSIHNFDFVFQSWGSGVIFYLVYNYLGLYGIIILITIVAILTSYFFYKLCFLVSNSKRASTIITLLSFILYFAYVVSRPHIFTVLNLVIMLYLLESYVRTNNTKYLYWLPLITLLQINMHGIYFILLLIICSPYLINSFKFKLNFLNIESRGYRKKPLIIVFICMLLTGFINPYGYKTIIYGFSSYSANSLFNNTIIELMSLDFHKIIGKIYIATIIITFVLHFSKLKERPLRYTLLLLGTSYLAFDAMKSTYLFVFCSLFPLTLLLKNEENIDKIYSKKYHICHLIITIVVCVGSILVIKKPHESFIKPLIEYLDENVTSKEEIKLFTDYYTGSYAEYRGYYCYLDPRGEVFLKSNNKKEDIYEEFDSVENNKFNYKDWINKYGFDYMIVKKNSSLGYLMKDNSYRYVSVKETNMYTLYKLDGENENEAN